MEGRQDCVLQAKRAPTYSSTDDKIIIDAEAGGGSPPRTDTRHDYQGRECEKRDNDRGVGAAIVELEIRHG